MNRQSTANYHPQGAARELFYARDGEVLLEGPAGTGKTRAVLEKVFLCAQRYPGMRALLARKTRASMTQSVLVTLHHKVLPDGHRLQRGAGRAHRQSYQLRNGSELVIGGLDNTDRIMSTEYDLIAIFEATEASPQDWEKLLTRLRHGVMPYQQAIADCNPATPSHWLNVRAHAGHMLRLRSRHEDNPLFWDAAGAWTPQGKTYVATLDRLSGVRHQRLRLGHWAAAEGLVYPTLAQQVLAMPDGTAPPQLPAAARRVVAGVDWGYHDPLAVVVGALAADRRLYIVDDYQSKLTTGQMRTELKRLQQHWRIETFYCDRSRPDHINEMRCADLPCVPARPGNIEAGIARIENRLRPAGGYLKIYVTCRNLLREAGEYEYGRTADGAIGRQPVDQANHAMDALRYLVDGLDYPEPPDFPDQDAAPAPAADEIERRLGYVPETPEAAAARAAQEAARRRHEMAWGR